jgi:hypothetical protein
MQAHATHAGAALALARGQILGIDAVAHPQYALTGPPAGSDASRDGGTVELGEKRLLLAQGIGLRGIRFGAETSALEEASDAPGDLSGRSR